MFCDIVDPTHRVWFEVKGGPILGPSFLQELCNYLDLNWGCRLHDTGNWLQYSTNKEACLALYYARNHRGVNLHVNLNFRDKKIQEILNELDFDLVL